MSEQNENTPIVETNNAKNDSTQAETNDSYKDVPDSRFEDVIAQKNKANDRANTLQTELDKMKADQESVRKKKLEDDGQLKTLLDEQAKDLDKYKAEADEFTEYKANKRADIMETITNDADKEIADGMPLAKLEKFANRVTQTNTVGTPNQRPANSTKGTGEFGGYGSWEEFAIKDPKGAEKAIADQTSQFIK